MSRFGETAVVVGAGLHGCSVALFLARAGWRVTVLEKNVACRHASGVNAGGLRLLMRDWREYPVAELAMIHWTNLAGLVGEEAATRCEVRLGTSQVAIALDHVELQWSEARAREMSRRGIGSEELLSQGDVRGLLPGVSRAVVGGLISRTDGHANPATSARAFREAARSAGATIIENSRVLGFGVAPGGGWTVETSTGRFECGVLLNCAGAWGSRIAALADESLPEQVKAPSMMVTARVEPFVTPVVIGIDRALSFKQSAAGTLVIGGGILGEPDLDNDTSFTVMDRMAASAAATIEAFPALAQVPVVRTWTGLEAATPDGIPIIGPGAKHQDLWHVFGFCGHGFQLAPGVGDLVARSLIAGTMDDRLAPFAARRFEVAPAPPTLGVES